MQKIYICSPLRDNVEHNIMRAREYCFEETVQGNLPIAPHIYFTQFMDDTNATQRNQAFEFNKELIKFCDKLHVYGEYISSGMQFEIEYAKSIGKEIIYKRRKKCQEENQT